ncbi:MAG: FtsX-like permease family protein [Flammeovirgaceae bacterium]|nr:FtsX-like permease family protein [Flammeovirgaceae bacterium]
MKFELQPNGNISYVYLFVTIALLVLLVAIVNYTNLAAARHTQRFKEVGVRKIFGASRKQLIVQFMIESFAVLFMALALAILVIEICRPLVVTIIGQEYLSISLLQTSVLLSTLGITILIGVLTGFIPALALSAFKPIKLFKVNISSSARGITLRKALVVFQFTISIVLTICTAITYQQVSYLQDAKLGYNLDHTIVLNIGYKEIHSQYEVLKSQLLRHTSVLGATAVSQLPTDIQTGENIDISKSETFGVNCVSVDPDFFKVMNIKVKQGEQLISSIRGNGTLNHFVSNESALASIGGKEDDVLSKSISIRQGNQHPGRVMGVVSDFHFQSLHHNIGPLVLEFNPGDYEYLLVKVKPENLSETIDIISSEWKKFAGNLPFEYMFLDQEYNNLYKSERRSADLFIVFSIIALLISLMGLFGLSSFTAERRTKEIALRKVLGANTNNILLLVSRNFLFLLTVSFAIAVPIGYYFMNTWLTNFAFKTSIGPSLFILAGVANFILALLTLSYHSIKVSHTNSVDALKYE